MRYRLIKTGLIKTTSTSAQTTNYGKLIHIQYKFFHNYYRDKVPSTKLYHSRQHSNIL